MRIKNRAQEISCVVPKNFSIEDNYSETMTFFAKVISSCEKKNERQRRIKIISKYVEQISESSLMYLYALMYEFHSEKIKFWGDYPKHLLAKELYYRTGFMKRLRYDDENKVVNLSDKAVLYRGVDANSVVAGDIIGRVRGFLDDDISMIYAALVELMDNTVEHAYIDDVGVSRKMWQVVVYCRTDDVVVVFLDVGKGIPNTVRTKFVSDVFKNDADLLKSAFMGEYRSRTGESHRGKGLPQIKEFMETDNVRSSFICSGKAVYDSRKGQFISNTYALRGTLFSFILGGRLNGRIKVKNS